MNKLIIFLLIISVSLPAFAKTEDKMKKQKVLPPGLEKKYERTGELPPGWQKKLVKGEVLDPYLLEFARHYPINPGDYSIKKHKGTQLLRIEDRIIRIMNDTKVILEVFGVKTD